MEKILDTKEVSRLRGLGFSQSEIGKKFGVTQQAVSRVLVILKSEHSKEVKSDG